jgi:hypothetical protein
MFDGRPFRSRIRHNVVAKTRTNSPGSCGALCSGKPRGATAWCAGATHLAEFCRRDEALPLVEKAIAVWQSLAADEPGVFDGRSKAAPRPGPARRVETQRSHRPRRPDHDHVGIGPPSLRDVTTPGNPPAASTRASATPGPPCRDCPCRTAAAGRTPPKSSTVYVDASGGSTPGPQAARTPPAQRFRCHPATGTESPQAPPDQVPFSSGFWSIGHHCHEQDLNLTPWRESSPVWANRANRAARALTTLAYDQPPGRCGCENSSV